MKLYYVYILKCVDGKYYTGVTNDLDRRINEHQSGFDKTAYTYTRRPIKLVFHTYFKDVKQAISFEKQVKKWSRKKKEAIIKDEWESLKSLAECKNKTSHKNYLKSRKKPFDSPSTGSVKAAQGDIT